MKRSSRRLLAAVCVFALAISSVVPALATPEAVTPGFDPRAAKLARAMAPAGDMAAAETPDVGNTPTTAAPLPLSAVTGTLNVATDAVDVYWVDLLSTDRIGLTITGDAALNADVYLYAPNTSNIVTSSALAGTTGDAFEKSLTHRAGTTGRYYVAVAAAAGAGTYTVQWYAQPWNADGDSEIPGLAGSGGAYSDSVDDKADPDDVIRVAVAENQRLSVQLGPWDGSLAPELHLFAPGAASVLTAVPVASAVSGSPRTLVYDVPAASGKGGNYYIDVRARSGAGDYSLTWTVTTIPSGTWKNVGSAVALPTSPASTTLGTTAANMVYRVTLRAGQRFDARLVSPAGADFDLYVYPAGTSSVFTASPAAWADGFAGDDALVYDAAVAGTYYVEVRQFTGSGAFQLHWAIGTTPVLGAADRIWGSDRYQTAIDTSKKTFAAGSCPTVVLATGADFADALSASGLAGAYSSPVLLTPPGALPAGLTAELNRLGAKSIVIIGGPVAVSAAAQKQLTDAGFATSRAEGSTRYETAADVARKIRAITGARADSPAFVVRGDLFPDALAAAPIAYRGAFPVLLTQSTALTPTTAAVIAEIGVNEIVIAGGVNAVSTGVETMLGALAGVRTVHREAGDTRYDTATKLATYATRMWWASNEYVGVATGANFPDALGGGAAAGFNGGVVLLSTPTVLAAPTDAYLRANKADVLNVKVFGGTVALSDVVQTAIDAALK